MAFILNQFIHQNQRQSEWTPSKSLGNFLSQGSRTVRTNAYNSYQTGESSIKFTFLFCIFCLRKIVTPTHTKTVISTPGAQQITGHTKNWGNTHFKYVKLLGIVLYYNHPELNRNQESVSFSPNIICYVNILTLVSQTPTA